MMMMMMMSGPLPETIHVGLGPNVQTPSQQLACQALSSYLVGHPALGRTSRASQSLLVLFVG